MTSTMPTVPPGTFSDYDWEVARRSALEMFYEYQERARARNLVPPPIPMYKNREVSIANWSTGGMFPEVTAIQKPEDVPGWALLKKCYYLSVEQILSDIRTNRARTARVRLKTDDGVPTYATEEEIRQRYLIKDLLAVRTIESQALRELQMAGYPDSEIIRIARLGVTDAASRLLVNQLIDQYLPGRTELKLTVSDPQMMYAVEQRFKLDTSGKGAAADPLTADITSFSSQLRFADPLNAGSAGGAESTAPLLLLLAAGAAYFLMESL